MILAQDGSKRSDKIRFGLMNNLIDGAIFCPCHEKPSKFKNEVLDYIKDFPNKFFIMDPHFHVSMMQANNIGGLLEYPFFKNNLVKEDFTIRNIQKYVKDVLKFQIDIGFNYIVSPSTVIDSFKSPWAYFSLQLYIESAEYIKSQKTSNKLLICLPIYDFALSEEEYLNEYLDNLTGLDVSGFYIIIIKPTSIHPNWNNTQLLSKLLYIIYQLSENDYEIYFGYTDIIGIIFEVFGANGFANGWWWKLRQFEQDRFIEKKGYGRRKPTYTSENLLNSITIVPELRSIAEIGKIDDVLSGTSFDEILRASHLRDWSNDWTQKNEIFNHWKVLSNISKKIEALKNIKDKMTTLENMINHAIALYKNLRKSGISFKGKSNPTHLQVWIESINRLKQII